MKKRMLSVLLAFVLAFGIVTPALAEDGSTPASFVQFYTVVGYGGYIDIVTSFVVTDSHKDINTVCPSLYIQHDGALTLLRTFTPYDCAVNRTKPVDSAGNAVPSKGLVELLFTEEEYLTFDFTADYVLVIPAGIFTDESGNPMEQQSVTFSGSDIQNDRNVGTVFGRIYGSFQQKFYGFLLPYSKVPFLVDVVGQLHNIIRYLFNIFNIQLVKPVTVG
jgi:hypothetical protein